MFKTWNDSNVILRFVALSLLLSMILNWKIFLMFVSTEVLALSYIQWSWFDNKDVPFYVSMKTVLKYFGRMIIE